MSYSMEQVFQIDLCKVYSDAINLCIEQLKQSKDLNSIHFINLGLLIQLKLKRLSNSFVPLNLPQFKPLMGTFQFRNLIKL